MLLRNTWPWEEDLIISQPVDLFIAGYESTWRPMEALYNPFVIHGY